MGVSVEMRLFEEKKPFESSVVWACAAYSLVPFLGIIFVPLAILFALYYFAVGRGDPRSSAVAVAASLAVMVGQLVLWWLLYMVPKWSGHSV